MTLPGRIIFLLSLAALLAACKLTATQSSNIAQREQEVKEANHEKNPTQEKKA